MGKEIVIEKGQRCLVVGSGISGLACVGQLQALGISVVLYDSSDKLTEADLKGKLEKTEGVECVTGSSPERLQWLLSPEREWNQVVLSPGVPTDLPWIVELAGRGIPILGEIELGYLAEKGRVAAITGTNGKTTTTTLVGEIMKAHLGSDHVFVVGNIGRPYPLDAMKTTPDTVTVGEISSFQLETVHTFHPHVSAILNITPDHLNRHHTMEAYVAVKQRIAENQTREDICVLNDNDPYTAGFADRCPARVVSFSSVKELSDGYFLRGEEIVRAKEGRCEALLNIHRDMRLVGTCNVENVMAAIAIGEGMGVPMDTILSVIRTFRAVEHRIEYVAEIGGVTYYNDSKGTNPDAAIQGIRAMSRPTVLIGGGYDKQSEYDEWIESFEGKVKWLVLIGQTKEKIADCARKHGFTRIRFADTFEECLQECTRLAEPGDAVLLSPACASWGMFPNYEVRGKLFKEYVNGLKE